MVPDRPRHLVRDVGLHELRTPPAMVDLHQRLPKVVQEAGEDLLLGGPLLQGTGRTLQQVPDRGQTGP